MLAVPIARDWDGLELSSRFGLHADAPVIHQALDLINDEQYGEGPVSRQTDKLALHMSVHICVILGTSLGSKGCCNSSDLPPGCTCAGRPPGHQGIHDQRNVHGCAPSSRPSSSRGSRAVEEQPSRTWHQRAFGWSCHSIRRPPGAEGSSRRHDVSFAC